MIVLIRVPVSQVAGSCCGGIVGNEDIGSRDIGSGDNGSKDIGSEEPGSEHINSGAHRYVLRLLGTATYKDPNKICGSSLCSLYHRHACTSTEQRGLGQGEGK